MINHAAANSTLVAKTETLKLRKLKIEIHVIGGLPQPTLQAWQDKVVVEKFQPVGQL